MLPEVPPASQSEDTSLTDEMDELESPTLTQSGAGTGDPGPGKALQSAPSSLRVGIPRALKNWERYEVQKVIGSGGMGAVYKARDPRLGRFVALKIVHPMLGHMADSAGDVFLRRFMREARLQASLDHPHICKVFEVGELPSQDEQPGSPYIAMQLIDGSTQKRPSQREPHIEAGLAAVAKALAINPRLTLGLVTAGELYLLRAETAPSQEARRAAAQSAVAALAGMLKNDPIFAQAYAPLLAQAQALGSANFGLKRNQSGGANRID